MRRWEVGTKNYFLIDFIVCDSDFFLFSGVCLVGSCWGGELKSKPITSSSSSLHPSHLNSRASVSLGITLTTTVPRPCPILTVCLYQLTQPYTHPSHLTSHTHPTPPWRMFSTHIRFQTNDYILTSVAWWVGRYQGGWRRPVYMIISTFIPPAYHLQWAVWIWGRRLYLAFKPLLTIRLPSNLS